MATKIFVNLPVQDLDRSVAFYTKLGYSFNAKFTDENATCMIVSDDIYVMLLVKPFFQTFVSKPIGDASKNVLAILSVNAEDRAGVDALVEKAIAAGAKSPEPKDYGFMYQRGYEDPDGHQWEVFYMDPDADPSAAQSA
jgi:predicted lactoylglutathione lyase